MEFLDTIWEIQKAFFVIYLQFPSTFFQFLRILLLRFDFKDYFLKMLLFMILLWLFFATLEPVAEIAAAMARASRCRLVYGVYLDVGPK